MKKIFYLFFLTCVPYIAYASTAYTWASQSGAGLRTWSSVTSSADGSKLAAGVYGGYIYTSNDGGLTWLARTGLGITYTSTITSSSDGTKLVVAGNTGIYTSTDWGANWVFRTNMRTTSNGRDIAISDDGMKLAAIVQIGLYFWLYTSTDGGATWNARIVVNQVGPCCASSGATVQTSSNGNIIAVAGDVLYLSADGGLTWSSHTPPAGYAQGDLGMSADGMKLAWLGNPYFADYIYTSIDGGITWTQRTSGVNYWSIIVVSGDGSRIIAETNDERIFISVDGGVSWINISTPVAPATASGQLTLASSFDGSKLITSYSNGYIWTGVSQNCTHPLNQTLDGGGFDFFLGAVNQLINRFGFNFCISNASTRHYFIPAKTILELQSFYNAVPRLEGVSTSTP